MHLLSAGGGGHKLKRSNLIAIIAIFYDVIQGAIKIVGRSHYSPHKIITPHNGMFTLIGGL